MSPKWPKMSHFGSFLSPKCPKNGHFWPKNWPLWPKMAHFGDKITNNFPKNWENYFSKILGSKNKNFWSSGSSNPGPGGGQDPGFSPSFWPLLKSWPQKFQNRQILKFLGWPAPEMAPFLGVISEKAPFLALSQTPIFPSPPPPCSYCCNSLYKLLQHDSRLKVEDF